MSQDRRRRLKARLREEGLGALLVSGRADVRYLCGFTGSNGWLLLTELESVLLTDARYSEQAPSEAAGCRVEVVHGSLVAATAKEVGAVPGTLALDARQLSHAAALELLGATQPRSWRRVPGIVAQLRCRKDANELEKVRDALHLAESVLQGLIPELEVGVTEREVAAGIEYAARMRGAERMAFETIVASGTRAALPHARPSGNVVEGGTPMVVDMGCVVDGYCCDVTRCVVLGESLMPPWDRIVGAVEDSLEQAIAAIRPGVAAREVDCCARAALASHDLDEYFTHGLGHGVGLQVHEPPRVSGSSDAVLQAGMVITVEPGVYLPGQGGVRLEEMVLVTAEGHERLNSLPTSPWFVG